MALTAKFRITIFFLILLACQFIHSSQSVIPTVTTDKTELLSISAATSEGADYGLKTECSIIDTFLRLRYKLGFDLNFNSIERSCSTFLKSVAGQHTSLTIPSLHIQCTDLPVFLRKLSI